MKLTLLNDFYALSGNEGKAGNSTYAEVINETILGSTVLKLKTGMAYMFESDVIDNIWTTKPTFGVPTGIIFEFEKGYKRNWYGRYYKI